MMYQDESRNEYEYEEERALDYLNYHLDNKCNPEQCVYCDDDRSLENQWADEQMEAQYGSWLDYDDLAINSDYIDEELNYEKEDESP